MKKGRSITISQSFNLFAVIIMIGTLAIASAVYYNVFIRTTDDLLEFQSREINRQIVLNYEGYIEDVVQTIDYLQLEALRTDVEDPRMDDMYQLSEELEEDIVTIILFDVLGNVLVASENKDVVLNVTFKPWYQDAINEKEIFHFSSVHEQDVFYDSNEQVVTVTKAFTYVLDGQKRTGVMLIDLNFARISEISANTNLGEDGHILILDEYDELIYSSDVTCRVEECESLELAREKVLGQVEGTIDGKPMMVQIDTLTNTRWRLATVLNTATVQESRQEILTNIVYIVLISFFFITLTSSIVTRRISNPLNELRKLMASIDKTDFYQEVKVKGQVEVRQLADSYNEMIFKIRELMDKVVFEQNAKRKNELLILQNQINPHFLYNALDSIVWLAENEKNDEVIETVIALSKLFRISLSKGRNFIHLEEEISHVENYLKVQHIRYRDRFDYIINVEESIKKLQVLKLIVQPLVENAIYHGIGGLDGRETIKIDAFEKDEFVYIEVLNTGYGMSDDKINELYANMKNNEKNSGVGMRNIYQRLKIYYGQEADVVIESELDEFTKVTLIIPKIKEEQ